MTEYINVTVQTTQPRKISVKPSTVAPNLQITVDPTQQNTKLSRDWAIGEGLIQNEDYSSKTWAGESKSSADLSKMYSEAASLDLDNVVNTINQYNEQLGETVNAGLTSIATAESNAIGNIEASISGIDEQTQTGIEEITTTKNNVLSEVATSHQNALSDINDTKTTAITEINATAQPILSELDTVEVVADNIDTVVEIGDNIDNILNKTVTVGKTTTGEEGTNAKVVNSGTKYNPILDFTIPRGDTGRDGGVYTEYDEETETLSMISKAGTALFPEWGYVQGELDNQSDLKNALDAKQPVGNYATKDEIPNLDGYVKNTDYATTTEAGLIKPTPYFGTNVDSSGAIHASPYTVDQLKPKSEYTFISKGTLENIKDDYVKRGLTENAIELTDEEKTSARTLIGAGSQAVLDTKADDSKVVHRTGTEYISGVKTFDFFGDNLRISTSNTTAYRPTSAYPALHNTPWARNNWHDHFAFMNSFTVASKEVTTDGEVWVADDRDIANLFMQKEAGLAVSDYVIAPNAGEMGFRFTLYGANVAYSNIKWLEIGLAYTSSSFSVRYIVEKSTDNATWTELHNSTGGASANNRFLYLGQDIASSQYIRFTILKESIDALDYKTYMLYLKGWTYRKGNQGRGIEFEKPYDWDNQANILPKSTGKNLGSANRQWNNVYANKLIIGSVELDGENLQKLLALLT